MVPLPATDPTEGRGLVQFSGGTDCAFFCIWSPAPASCLRLYNGWSPGDPYLQRQPVVSELADHSADTCLFRRPILGGYPAAKACTSGRNRKFDLGTFTTDVHHCFYRYRPDWNAEYSAAA